MKTPSGRKLVTSVTTEALNTEKENFNILKLLIDKTYKSNPKHLPECYASLVTHLSMTSSFLTSEVLLPLIGPSLGGGEVVSLIDLCVLGALIKSGCLATWDETGKKKVVQHLLDVFINSSDYDPIIFDSLLHIIHNEEIFGKISKSDWITNLNKTSPLVHALFFLHLEGELPEPNANQVLLVSIIKHNANANCGTNLLELFYKKLCCCEFFQDIWNKLLSEISSQSGTPSVEIQRSVVLFFLSYTKHSDLKFIEEFMAAPLIEFLIKKNCYSHTIISSIAEVVNRLKDIPDQNTKVKLIEKILKHSTRLIPNAFPVKIMEGMIMTLEKHGLVMIAKEFKQIYSGKKGIRKRVSIEDRLYSLQSFTKLISHPKCYDDVLWRKTQLRFLFSSAFLSKPEDLPQILIVRAKACFFTSLQQRYPTLKDYCTVLDSLVTLTSENLENKGFSIPMSSQFLKLWESSLKCLDSISEDPEDTKLLHFRVMISYMMLISFLDFKTAKEAIEEIIEVLKQIQEGDKKDLHWNDVMVDLCLSLLSEPKTNYRSIVNFVFGQLCGELTPEGLELILGSLRGESLTEGDETGSENSEDEGDDVEGEESEDDESEESENDEGEVSEDEDRDLGPETLNEKLREALRDELYKADTASTAGSIDLDSMDEEEGKKLNQTLGEIFKSQAGMKGKDTKQLDIHTRAKFIDMLEILVSKDPPLSYILQVISTSFDLIKECIVMPKMKFLVEALKKCIRIIAQNKYSNVSGVSQSDLTNIINKILEHNHPKNVIIEISDLISLTYLMILKLAQLIPNVDMEKIFEPAVHVLENFFSDLQTYPFHVLIAFISSRNVDLVLKLVPDIIEIAFNEKETPVRKTHAMKLLLAFYNNKVLFIQEKWSKRLEAIEVNLLLKCNEIMSKIADKSLTVSISFGASLFDLLTYLKKSTEKHSDEFSKLESSLPSCVKNFPSFVSTMKKSFNRFCRIYNMPELVCTNDLKRKSGDASPENGLQTEGTPKKKRLSEGEIISDQYEENVQNSSVQKSNKKKRASTAKVQNMTPKKVKKKTPKKKNSMIIL